ncbi:uroporphyrinogen-III synthase [Agrobacterium rubi]|uniref:uroporphyrinogen-III synthase n=1 Tax=Agrobacterium rubi TaxID=28099 RepID=UPI00157294E7|nr:uroporphyrinogen-III synthase [Agrobacterium rubi]NTF08800.1 uroporphyrinogen-III synthase [Agrobacterium rubi]NTF21028.1 uroporphyrinogen-III synthase [Agrobacterium rubi]NTF27927.1 uroporphyrinogen-III synthase [Agrobacterium rubi]
MRVVVTRPEASGLKTAKLLRERGHDPILLPLTIAVHDTNAAIAAFAKTPASLAVTSAEAIRALVGSGADLSTSLHRPLFAVGEASAKAARDAGFEAVITGGSDGTALAQRIADDDASHRGTVLYLAGTPRDQGFEHKLVDLNVPYETVEIYHMQPVPWPRQQLQERIADAPVDAVLFYSSEAARIFFALMEKEQRLEQLRHCKMICISSKVLSHVPAAFQNAAFASGAPSEFRMFDLLDRNAGT